MNTSENAAFEHAAKHILALAKVGDKYQDGYTQTCWELWKTRAALPGPAAADVLAERQRQITAEGWTPEHDDEHMEVDAGRGLTELARAAKAYIEADVYNWPWTPISFKPTSPRSNLVKAGALILAEIERLDRLSPNTEVVRHAAKEER